ncbi:TPA: polysaccharide pyruvyl transferase family protein, partial [Klebsiella pneumoniae]|nr:polysaccharide pyruvyl transferase family protein [Klebsiella pneumoniae]
GDSNLEIITEGDPLKVKGIIGASAALVSSRFHGCVSALCQGIPCLGTSWSHKYERLFEDYGREKFLLTPEMTIEQIQLLLEECMNKNTTEFEAYNEKIQELKKDSEKMWDEISIILDK